MLLIAEVGGARAARSPDLSLVPSGARVQLRAQTCPPLKPGVGVGGVGVCVDVGRKWGGGGGNRRTRLGALDVFPSWGAQNKHGDCSPCYQTLPD